MNIEGFLASLEEQAEQIKLRAAELFLEAAERAKASLGEDGKSIVIRRLAAPEQNGNELKLADMFCPSKKIERLFQAAVKREMSQSER